MEARIKATIAAKTNAARRKEQRQKLFSRLGLSQNFSCM